MEEFVYLSAKEGHVVARYGSGTATRRNAQIGAVQGTDGYVQTDEVVKIPWAEWVRYLKEYTRALSAGALVRRTVQDYDAWVAESTARSEADRAAAVASAPELGPEPEAAVEARQEANASHPEPEKAPSGKRRPRT